MKSHRDLLNDIKKSEELLQKFIQLMRSGDLSEAEKICRKGLELVNQVRCNIHNFIKIPNLPEPYGLSVIPDYSLDIAKIDRAAFNIQIEFLRYLSQLYLLSGNFQKSMETANQMLAFPITNDERTSLFIELILPIKMMLGKYKEIEEFLMETVITPISLNVKLKCIEWLTTINLILGDLPSARSLAQDAIKISKKIYGESSSRYALSMLDMAKICAISKDYEEAIGYYNKAVQIIRNDPNSSLLDYIVANLALADIYMLERKFEEAEKLCMILLQTMEEKELYSFKFRCCMNLAVIYTMTGQLDKAETALELLLGALPSTSAEEVILKKLYSMILAHKGKTKEALSLMREATSTFSNHKISRISIGTVALLRGFDDVYSPLLSLTWRYLLDDPEAIEEALNFVLKHKAMGLETEILSTLVMNDSAFKQSVKKISNQVTNLFESLRNGQEKTQRRYSIDLKAKLTELKSLDILKKLPDGFDLYDIEKEIKDITYDKIIDTLPPKTALIEFAAFQPILITKGGLKHDNWRYVAFILQHDKAPVMVDLGEVRTINSGIYELRRAVFGRSDAIEEYCSKLYEILFEPLERFISNISHIIICTDGELSVLPFEILILPNGRFLIDKYKISYLTTGRDTLRLNKIVDSVTPKKDVVILANPDFNLNDSVEPAEPITPSGGRKRGGNIDDLYSFILEPLDWTEEEAKRIRNILENRGVHASNIWLGKEAVKRRIKQIHSPFILHIATHGIFLPSRDYSSVQTVQDLVNNMLMRSGLALSGYNRIVLGERVPNSVENGLLTGLDVQEMNLLGTELVVLSACDTGLGEIFVGESVFGLRRAFILSGAKTLVMSLWQVPDRETCTLMEDFYRNLLSGMDKAEALRQAQLKLKKEMPHPYYWGGFICQGDISPLKV